MVRYSLLMDGLNLIELFSRGGFIMWPLLILGILAMAAIIDRFIYFKARLYKVPDTLDRLQPLFEDGAAAASSDEAPKDPLFAMGAAYYKDRDADAGQRAGVLRRRARALIQEHEARVRLLATIAAIAPLIGLLGTVWGMVQAFYQIEAGGDQVRPSDFAGGIWEGLLTTVFGLAIAIPSLAAVRIFEGKIERLANDMNDLVSVLDEWTGQRTE